MAFGFSRQSDAVLVSVIAVVFALNELAPAAGPIVLRDVTDQTGITFRHTDGGSGKRYIMETVSAGLALFDYDNDGDIDVYFLNGAPLEGTTAETPPTNALYRNDGGFRFTDVTESAGVGDPGYGLGVVAGDYDNDGDNGSVPEQLRRKCDVPQQWRWHVFPMRRNSPVRPTRAIR